MYQGHESSTIYTKAFHKYSRSLVRQLRLYFTFTTGLEGEMRPILTRTRPLRTVRRRRLSSSPEESGDMSLILIDSSSSSSSGGEASDAETLQPPTRRRPRRASVVVQRITLDSPQPVLILSD